MNLARAFVSLKILVCSRYCEILVKYLENFLRYPLLLLGDTLRKCSIQDVAYRNPLVFKICSLALTSAIILGPSSLRSMAITKSFKPHHL